MSKKAEKGLVICDWSNRITFVLMESEGTLWPHNHLDTGVGVHERNRQNFCVCVRRGVPEHVGPNVYKSISVDTVANGH